MELHVGRGVTREGLTLFPVWVPAAAGPRRYAVRGALEVAECPDGPSVGQLVVANHGPRPALVLEGELLRGGWQDRTVNRSGLVAAGGSWSLDVSCVEAGRWRGGGGHARTGRRVPPGVRAATGRPVADRQGQVWQRVAGYERAWAASPTSSLDVVAGRVRGSAAALVEGLRPLPGQAGVLVGVGGQPLLLEVFDSPRTLAETWRELLVACATEALAARAAGATAVPTPGRRARRFAARVAAVGLGQPVAAGLGATLTGTSAYASLRALRWEQRTVHLVAVNSRHELALAA